MLHWVQGWPVRTVHLSFIKLVNCHWFSFSVFCLSNRSLFFSRSRSEREKESKSFFSSSPQGVKRNTGSTVFGSVDVPEVTVMETWPSDLQIHTHTHTHAQYKSSVCVCVCHICTYSIGKHLNSAYVKKEINSYKSYRICQICTAVLLYNT